MIQLNMEIQKWIQQDNNCLMNMSLEWMEWHRMIQLNMEFEKWNQQDSNFQLNIILEWKE